MAVNPKDFGGVVETGKIATDIFKQAEEVSLALKIFGHTTTSFSKNEVKLEVEVVGSSKWVSNDVDNENKGFTTYKPVATLKYSKVSVLLSEQAVIIPFHEDMFEDADFADYNFGADAEKAVVSKFSEGLDNTVFKTAGSAAHALGGQGLQDAAVTSGKIVTSTSDFAADVLDAVEKVEEDGYEASYIIVSKKKRSALRKAATQWDTPAYDAATQTLFDIPVIFSEKLDVEAMVVDSRAALIVLGNGIKYKWLSETAIYDDVTGELLYNLGQEDMVALRAATKQGRLIGHPLAVACVVDGSES